MFRNQKIPLKRCEYFVQSVLRGMNWQESAEGEIHVTNQRNTCLVIRKTLLKRCERFVQSVVRRMNRQESAEGDVVKREDGVARAFRVQPIPAIEVSGYIWIFRTSKCSSF